MGIDFYNTAMGRRFFESSVPSLVKAIEKMANEQAETNRILKCSLEQHQTPGLSSAPIMEKNPDRCMYRWNIVTMCTGDYTDGTIEPSAVYDVLYGSEDDMTATVKNMISKSIDVSKELSEFEEYRTYFGTADYSQANVLVGSVSRRTIHFAYYVTREDLANVHNL